ncbi:MAG: bifunctional 5,10-methylene-tetrahydrofolate dehydrogenase/5,10-methylene-tetrahydrofolate cyclohydrolase [Proteobacteria bacterium]|nr:bifunctional 5,10-methylene-tetrahydrofolate dehydrogenase/5,10-methylene-tetrahydrofolate cyclohydrolase [Pseudomonadota bacterium]
MSLPAVTHHLWRGAPLRDALLAQVREAVAAAGGPVRLAIVQVGDNPASHAYVRHKLAACRAVGVVGEHIHLREDEGEAALHSVLAALAREDTVQAMIVQTPLPAGWDVRRALDMVPAAKDIDGLSSASTALRRAGDARALWPATPLGVVRILANMDVELAGNQVAVIGKGMVVGAPLQEILTAMGAKVAGIDKDTPQPARLCRAAEILVAATGAPGLVTRDWVKPGAVVIDVGITRVPGHGRDQLLGDVDRASVEGVARLLTPVPGGVGPMTVASLFTNIVDAMRLQKGQPKQGWRVDAVQG